MHKQKFHLYTKSNNVDSDKRYLATIRKDSNNITCTSVDGYSFEEEFFCTAHIKWDSCSHFHMADYHHVCGVDGYSEFIQIMWFCHQVAMLDHEYKDEEEEIKEFNSNPLFDNMVIEKVDEWNEEDDTIVKEYNKW